ncbi:glycogen/starch synthase [Candidatus Haliotispira prima]|uniref:Glycogen synthase n=1 Tax=Candidatus Haliotispira prima TaxID=3034016 RepID=A0ABY8MDU0_9SPIO|nr:glycogen/starch synthase [Candidatus Haliotispira prima]
MNRPDNPIKDLDSNLKGPKTSIEKRVENVLFLAPEWGTIIKVGGLADVVASLSRSLRNKGLEVRTVLLGYRHIRMKLRRKYFNPQLPFFLLEECTHPEYPDDIFYLVKHPALDAIQEPYTPSYSDNDSSLDLLQAILLALAPFAIAENPDISWQPDLVHCHDWLSGLFPYFNHFLTALLPNFSGRKIASLFTIHNAAYMGTFSDLIVTDFYKLLHRWGIALSPNFRIEAWKFQGQVNLLATGLRFTEKINTVSPTHALELLEDDTGISPILRERRPDFCGILNGVDDKGWSPSSDPYLKDHTYTSQKSDVAEAKLYWKGQLEEKLQFALNPQIPLLISICRVVKQKGLTKLFFFNDDTTTESPEQGRSPLAEALMQDRCQLIILGEGEKRLESQLQIQAWQYPKNFMFLNYFHEELAHILTAAADFFLMPSLYEPCGLNQIYSLRYGTTPIARRTGGLADTIEHGVNGLIFRESTSCELQRVLDEAFDLWHHKPERLWAMKQFGMKQNFSWQNNLDAYIELYNGSLRKQS